MKIITSFVFAFLMALTFSVSASGQVPTEVRDAFKAYQAAEKSGDKDAALHAARDAWQAAETHMGDVRLTGDLAFNYANQPVTKKRDDQFDAVERSMELAAEYGSDGPVVYMERAMLQIGLYQADGKNLKALRAAERLVDYADTNDLADSTFIAEALTTAAGIYANRGDDDKATAAAERALHIFENATDGIRSAYSIHANLYRGYAYENEGDHMGAALRYQEVMEMTDGLDPSEFSVVGTALGRWIYMRDALSTQDRLEDAEQNGLCQCWPYDKPRNEGVKPVKRTPPKMPRQAMQSGYVVVEFDLSDDGRVINEEVITAWPDYYEKPALKSMRNWEYSVRTADESDADRKDLVTTIKFRLSDENGKLIW